MTKPIFSLLFVVAICTVGIFIGCNNSCSKPDPNPSQPPSITEPEQPAVPEGGNGLSSRVFDNCLRIRTNGGSGSGSVIGETPTHYVVESNHHVTSKGTNNALDIFIGGKNVGSVKATTAQSWFSDGRARDVSEILIPKSALGGPLSVVEMAPPGYSAKLKPGMMIYTYGCQQGQWPRARCGHILEVNNGLIYYTPEAIPGDSGSAVYLYDAEARKEYCIGRTAWTTSDFKGKPAGMAMTSDRVRAIRRGEVADDESLPEGAKPIEPAPNAEAMESEAEEVFLRRWRAPRSWDPDAEETRPVGPIRNGLLAVRTGMTVRAGLGYAVMFLGLAVGGSVIFYVVTKLRG